MIVHLTRSAQDQADEIEAWLRERSPAAAERFQSEIARALGRLAVAPHSGAIFRRGPARRLLLSATSHHLYYTIAGDVLTIRAVWHSARGRGPKLSR